MIDAVGSVVSGLDVDASLVEQTSSALLSVAANGSGLAVSAAASALDSALGLSSSSTGIGITAIAAAELGNTLSMRDRARRGGTTTCECGVDTAGDAPPLDYSTKEEKTDAGSVYFKNLTEPPDLSRAVVMIYALLALLLACVAAHAYGLRLDARDAARAPAVAAASDADDDPTRATTTTTC
ncbi:hypothetical protein JL720_12041 [Aureococcus anophagefferens]|nr:hypothetical protein JL720_12041 [Aureococcus anophagefferens]